MSEERTPFELTIWYWPAKDTRPDEWNVSLPHQCGDWEITGEYSSPATKSEAVDRLRRFIDEATAVLEHLVVAPDVSDEMWSWSINDA